MRTYEDFEVQIFADREGFRAQAGRAGESQRFNLNVQDLTERWKRLAVAFAGRDRSSPEEIKDAEALGGELFRAVFSGNILRAWGDALARADERNPREGVRLVLRVQESGLLASLPWELLFDADHQSLLALSEATPILRLPDVAERARLLPVRPPLRLLGVLAEPLGQPLLDLEGEWQAIEKALAPLRDRGLVEIERLVTPTLPKLRERLKREPAIHALHFAGHGVAGALDLERNLRDRHREPALGQQLATLVGDAPHLRLVVINTCDGAKGFEGESTSSLAFHLARRGLPAIVALQSAVSDGAARLFAQSFYGEIARGNPLEAAVTEARNVLDAEHKGLAWAAPVLFLRAPSGHLFVQPAVRFTSHKARFVSDPTLCYFLNVTNVSREPIEITHLWFEGAGKHISVNLKSRPLPHLLEAEKAWSTWIPIEALPESCRAEGFDHFQLRVSTGETFRSTRDVSMPPAGSVPGGEIQTVDKPTSAISAQGPFPAPARTLFDSMKSPRRELRSRLFRWVGRGGALLAIFGSVWFVLLNFRDNQPVPRKPSAPVRSDPRCPSPPGLDFAFQWIKPGEFWMGAPEGQGDRTTERPRHRVKLTKAFCVGAYEVTEKQWNEGAAGVSVETRPGEDRPKVMITWTSVNEFIRLLNEREPGANYRLLTEAEFEYISSAHGIAAFSFGDNRENLRVYGNFLGDEDGYADLAPIGSFAPNQLNLFDLHGNAQEWVEDWFDLYPKDGALLTDPQGPKMGTGKVRKGGSYETSAETCSAWSRSNSRPDRRQRDLGFRIARSPVQSEIK